MEIVNSVEAAKQRIESFVGEAEEFAVPISDTLQDQWGINMAIITDHTLAKGWEPKHFEQREGFRVYRYKAME